MGGRIGVESAVGRGSDFRFAVRFGVRPAPAGRRPSPPPLRDLPVLVADDNATNRRILHATLTGWDMRPTAVDDGVAALAALAEAAASGRPFALALLDGLMPGMDGFAVAERVRRDPLLAGTALILLTSAAGSGGAARCRELRVAALPKPVKDSDLHDAVVRALRLSLEQRPAPVVRAGPGRACRPKGLRILVAEDNVVNRRLIALFLEQEGHQFVPAVDGAEAIALSARERFDLVLMDIHMPRMNGFEATAAIRDRERPTGRHVPIIALTADAMKGDRERCLRAGMDGYLSKPIREEELFGVIATAVAGRSQPPARGAEDRPAGGAVDEAAVLRRVKDNREVLKELVGLFLEDGSKLMADAEQALRGRDGPALALAAHTLKGSAGVFAAAAAAEAAFRLETIGREGDWGRAKEAWAGVRREMARLTPALTALAEGARS